MVVWKGFCGRGFMLGSFGGPSYISLKFKVIVERARIVR